MISLGVRAGLEFETGLECFAVGLKDIARHTAVFAASGAGKSSLLARLIEELTLARGARTIVLDTNADYVHAQRINEQVWEHSGLSRWFCGTDTLDTFRARWENANILLASSLPLEPKPVPLKLEWGSLSLTKMGTFLGIQSSKNSLMFTFLRLNRSLAEGEGMAAEEVNVPYTMRGFLSIAREMRSYCLTGDCDLARKGTYETLIGNRMIGFEGEVLRYVAEVERVGEYPFWTNDSGDQSLCEHLRNEAVKTLIIDLQSLSTREERLILTSEVLSALWAHCRDRFRQKLMATPDVRDDRLPHFVVLDEAHSWIPEIAESEYERAVSEQLKTIAAEGRKYGIYLVVATQRPRKVHPDVLSECDSVFLMRILNPKDLQFIAERFGYSRDILRDCRAFSPGECFLLGGANDDLVRLHVSPRRTVEGGGNLTLD
ncbi:ATP-binding protein [Candidatus Bipolaricaulota bacterium]|nr:ATP-binding protein [Candidatus Bipolaricaulota bacterium]